MSITGSPGSVVVGIDGSRAAITAAKWAIDEAVERDVPLRLVHVTDVGMPATDSHEDFGLTIEYAEQVLRNASATIEATVRPVKIETATEWGDVENALIEESFGAAMVCVGSVGISRAARLLLGSTAAALAENAHCPAAIIRSDGDAQPTDDGWIAVAVDDDFGTDAVIHMAMEEARLRGAPLLALAVSSWAFGEMPYDQLDRRLGKWVERYPDVHVQPVAAHHGAAAYLETFVEPVRLIVIGRSQAGELTRLVGPHNHPVCACSVLVVRQ